MKVFTIIWGILLAIGGFFSLLMPFATFRTVGWVIGIVLLISGFNLITDYFIHRKTKKVSKWDLLTGVLTIGVALFIFYGYFARTVLDTVVVVIFAIWILGSGIFRIASGLNLKRSGNKSWVWIMILGIVTLLMGVYGIFNPYIFKFAIGWMIGLFILMQGINMVGLGIVMNRKGE